jgi:glycosyltransferase involved in cell wall biosynthesis
MLLEQKLWGGFSNLASVELEAICENKSEHQYERQYAHWSLACWNASHHRWKSTKSHLDALGLNLPSFIQKPSVDLLRIETLLQTGNIFDAKNALDHAIERYGFKPEFCLAAANISYSDNSLDESRIEHINEIFKHANLTQLQKRIEGSALSLDNITGKNQESLDTNDCEKVSIIMPAYNACASITIALDSILKQTWSNIEIIVVDDCSTDETVTLVENIAKNDSRVILVRHKVNSGAYSARNTAIKYATGHYITNHDSDDWSHPQKLSIAVKALQENKALIGVFSNWVRVDSNLRFQGWRHNEGLIEPSISTLLFRREALSLMGGWDTVRVAADSEFHERLLRIYGSKSVAEIFPGIPLVLAKQWKGSLTNSAYTHARTSFFGVRKEYTAMASTWRSMASSPKGLRLEVGDAQRKFPAPREILTSCAPIKKYDCIIFGDFSDYNPSLIHIKSFIRRKIDIENKSIAIFHWPDYRSNDHKSMSDFFYARAIELQLDILCPNDSADTSELLVFSKIILGFPPDIVPKITYKHCRVIEANSYTYEIQPTILAARETNQNNLTRPINSQHFDREWYLNNFADVREAGVDPLLHYLNFGWVEKREPGPSFNTKHYLQQCPHASESGIPPLVHFLTTGMKLGHEPTHPTFQGYKEYNSKQSTIMVCGHASDESLFGAERSLLDLLDAFDKLKTNLIISIPNINNPNYIELLRKKSTKVFIVPCSWWSDSRQPCEYTINRFKTIYKENNVDAVHVNTIMIKEPLLAAKILNIPTAVHVHEIMDHDDSLCQFIGLSAEEIRNAVTSSADRIIANSIFTASRFKHHKINNIIPNTADTRLINLNHTLSLERINISLISSNIPKKGLIDFLEIANSLRNKINIKFNLIGPFNSHVRSIQLAAKEMNLSNIEYHGYLLDSVSAISISNIVLNLSHCEETFGRTVLEAMAGARPVLAYSWGALPELITDGLNGYLLPLKDWEGIAKKIDDLCSQPTRIIDMGLEGRKIYSEKYTAESILKQVKFIYNSTLKKKRKKRTSQH